MENKRFQLRLTIGTKLISLIALLLLSSIATIVYQSTESYVRNDKENIRFTNAATTGSLVTQVREVLTDLTDKMSYIGTILWQQPTINPAADPLISGFFHNDQDFLGLFVQTRAADGSVSILNRAISPAMANLGDADGSKALTALNANSSFSIPQLFKGEVQIVSFKLADGSTALGLAIPLVQSATDPSTFVDSVTAVLRPSKFSKMFAQNVLGSGYLVDHRGIVLAHTDSTYVGESFANLPVVKDFLSGAKPQNQVSYVDPVSKKPLLASYRAVGFAGMGVVAQVPEGLAYQAATTMEHRAVLVGLIILFIAFWAGYMYSGTITRPIKRLVEAAQRVANGDFKINLTTRGKDEIAHLSRSFNEMARGLEERDRVKETFNKFHNKEIAEKLLSGEVKLGGERKEATVFFSDVRGFTAMSETMEPEQVVEMLNEYMTRMVAIVRKHHGIVDKYVGDAIMALWGVPIGSEDDTYNAVRACLEMREELARLNELRISRGQSALKIGMGLNVGPVIAGNIGSTEKMEYTVIGDSVNLASRMESMTKEYGTDLLIPKSIHDRLENRFIFEKCKSAKVKGKSTAIEIYKVTGYFDEAGNAVVIETPYSSYAAEKSDKVVHDEPEHTSSIVVEETSKLIGDTTGLFERPETTQTRISVADLEQFYVRMFGEKLGPFTADELRHGIDAGEFPADADFARNSTDEWTPIEKFRSGPVPPPFRKKAPVPPPFRGPKKSESAA